MPSLSVDLSGCTDLPAGKIANIVTFLEMRARPETREVARPDLRLERIETPDPADYRRAVSPHRRRVAVVRPARSR